MISAQAAKLHVMARQLRTGPDQDRLRTPADLHRVVGDEPVPADDEVEGALAFPDAAVPCDHDAEAEDVHQHRVQDRPLCQRVLQERRQLGNGRRRHHRGLQHRDASPLGFGDHLRRRWKASCDQHARKIECEGLSERTRARAGVEVLEESDFALTEHEDAAGTQVFLKPGERETGLLRMGVRDQPVETGGAGEQFDGESEGVRPAAE